MIQRNGTRRAGFGWVAALVAGALLRLLFFHVAAVAGDALMYGDIAHNMVAHHVYGFSATVIQPTLIRLPGYPLFLAACFAVFGGGELWRGGGGADVGGPGGVCAAGDAGGAACRAAGGVGGVWLAALCPFTANYSVVVLAETLSVFCVVVALVALERGMRGGRLGRCVGMGCGVGVCALGAVLLRPDEGIAGGGDFAGDGCGWGCGGRGLGVGRRVAPVVVAALIVVLPLWCGRCGTGGCFMWSSRWRRAMRMIRMRRCRLDFSAGFGRGPSITRLRTTSTGTMTTRG